MSVRVATMVAALMAVGTAAACGGNSNSSGEGAAQADKLFAKELDQAEGFRLSSPNFADGEALPGRFTCDGTDISPALLFEGVPEGTRELAIVMEDPEAKIEGKARTVVHWIVTGLVPDTVGLPEDSVPEAAHVARNGDGVPRYEGPCPAEGDPPRTYRFTLYAMSGTTGSELDANAAPEALDAIAEMATARTTLSVTYRRNPS
ncbi:MAG: YbhB/YbcL family Raf kinase inhibitor-like protein [Acidimicrobiales bacterium]